MRLKDTILHILLITLSLFGLFMPLNGQSQDSLSTDSSKLKSIQPNFSFKVDSTFKDKVDYTADDSLVFDYANSTVYMYGNAQVSYKDIQLNAAIIEFNFETNNVLAHGIQDTSGTKTGVPKFKEGEQVFDADTIKYNFKSKKGIIVDVGTEIADGFVFGERVKKTEDEVLYIEKAEYCPCEDKNAKTRIVVNKLKVIPDEKVVTGPWNLRIGKIPTPLAFFLGYFPNNQAESAGILIPQYGESDQLGFYLINGGWYQPLGDKADLQLTGDIYTKGSWGAQSVLRYRNNYRFNGDLKIKYNVLKNGIRGLNSYSEQNTTFINWSHRQDPKARPNSSFSANLNIGSSASYRNTINTSIDNFLTNTFQSNISYNQRFPGKPYSIGLAANHSQNTNTEAFNITLPSFTFNLSRVFLPLSFLKREGLSKTMWYEKIGFTMSSVASNQLSTQESELNLANLDHLIGQSRNGIRHNASLSTNLKAWHFNINPSMRFTDRMYFKKLERSYDLARDQAIIDTVSQFNNLYDYSFSTGITTKLYGMYAFKSGPVKAIRHVLIPTASINYSPSFNHSIAGNFGDSASYVEYNPYSIGIYGVPNSVENGGISLSLQNNVEMKVKDRQSDEESLKKVKIIEALNLNSSYNHFADSLRWSNISSNFRTQLFKSLGVIANAIFDPYAVDFSNGNNYESSYYRQTGKIARLTNANLALTYNLNLNDYISTDPEKFSFTANTSFNYTVNRTIADGGIQEQSNNSFTVRGDLKMLNRFRLSYYTGYDFEVKKATTSKLDLYIDLNCWEARIAYVPTGFLKSLTFSINMKSAILKDVKYQRIQNFSDDAKLL